MNIYLVNTVKETSAAFTTEHSVNLDHLAKAFDLGSQIEPPISWATENIVWYENGSISIF